jgi:hypothetical protein
MKEEVDNTLIYVALFFISRRTQKQESDNNYIKIVLLNKL